MERGMASRRATLVLISAPLAGLALGGTASHFNNEYHDAQRQTVRAAHELAVPAGCVSALRELRNTEPDAVTHYQATCTKVAFPHIKIIQHDINSEAEADGRRIGAFFGFLGLGFVSATGTLPYMFARRRNWSATSD